MSSSDGSLGQPRFFRVALVVPALIEDGGVPTVAEFVTCVLEESNRFKVRLISLAVSSADNASIQILSPKSWVRGVRVRRGTWKGRPYTHVGSRLSELEFMRYVPRRALTELLTRADLIHVVAGVPSWALSVGGQVRAPTCIHAATLTAMERAPRHGVERGPAGAWRRAMTQVTRQLDVLALRTVDRVFAMNSSLRDKAAAVCGCERVRLVTPGVNVKRFYPRSRATTETDCAYILSVARFDDPRKNVDLLFRSYSLLKRWVPTAPPLWLAGSSAPPESAWKVVRESGVIDSIRYLGRVSDAKLAELYRGALFFVLSSEEEGFGLVLVEAMASGIPVVTTDCGGPRDIVTDDRDGLLVPTGTPAALAAAMKRLVLCPDLRAEMGMHARQTAASRYSFEVAGARILTEYHHMLSNGPSNSRRRWT